MVNRDLEIPRGSDYVFKFECLGENNAAYVFAEEDLLKIELCDIEGKYAPAAIDIATEDASNPFSATIPYILLDTFDSNPIKYTLTLIKAELTLVLLSGYINLI